MVYEMDVGTNKHAFTYVMHYQRPTLVVCNGKQCNVQEVPHEDDISYLVQHAVRYGAYASESMCLATKSSEYRWLVFATEHVLDELRGLTAVQRLSLLKARKAVVASRIDRNGDVIGLPRRETHHLFFA